MLRNTVREHPVLNRIVMMMLLLLCFPFQAVLCFRVVWPNFFIAGPDPTSTTTNIGNRGNKRVIVVLNEVNTVAVIVITLYRV